MLIPDQITSAQLASAKEHLRALADAPTTDFVESSALLERLRGVSRAVSAITLSQGGIEIHDGVERKIIYQVFSRREGPDELGITNKFRVVPADESEIPGALMARQNISATGSLQTERQAFLPADAELDELAGLPPVRWDKTYINAINPVLQNGIIYPFDAVRMTPDAAARYLITVRSLCKELIDYTDQTNPS